MPASQVFQHDFTVVSNDEVADGIFRMVIDVPRLASKMRPGQFLSLEVPGDRSQLLRIPLSFASADAARGTIELIFAVVGDGTRRLSRLSPKDESTVLGPEGRGWPCPGGGRTLLVSGGVGAPPIIAAAGMLAAAGLEFDAILGAQTKARLWGDDRIRRLGADEVVVTTDDGSLGVRGLTTDAMSELLERQAYDRVMCCGPMPMMASVARLAEDRSIACLVSMERLMACGFGACGCCNVAMRSGGYRSCCMDGPIFDGSEVAW